MIELRSFSETKPRTSERSVREIVRG